MNSRGSRAQAPEAENGGLLVVGFMSAWGTSFLAMAIGISIVLHIVVVFPTGFSASSDVVFGTEALVSGVVSEAIIRKGWRRKLVPWEAWKVSVLWIWIPLCLYVIVAQPLK